MVYQWRTASVSPPDTDARRAQAVGEALNEVAQENGGVLVPQDVVAKARTEQSPLHRYFEWDDRKAARAHRLEQAKELIVSVSIVIPDADAAVPAFTAAVDGPSGAGRSYRPADMKTFTMPRTAAPLQLARAKSELLSWRRRYGSIAEFATLVGMIDETIADRS